jgi:hypothetical protein
MTFDLLVVFFKFLCVLSILLTLNPRLERVEKDCRTLFLMQSRTNNVLLSRELNFKG